MVGCKNNGDSNSNSFSKTICSICYEDLKPSIEDLQSISICGHVFHELCLQQWFEYCPNVKKRSCPICKQTCTNSNVGRLYFQSIGDSNDPSLSQKPSNYGENPDELRNEVNRLEGKVVAMASTFEQQQKEFKEVKDQLLSCKEKLKAEVALKIEALSQKATSQQLLRVKSEELDKSISEQMRLQERNITLAKELAALKLASDLDLEEDEVVKLASLGNDAGSRETVDVLKKSLVIRNKCYKELMAKCSVLGRGEARCVSKLEKANEKIKKLKSRVQELETAVEIKDNEALRLLKNQDTKFKTPSHDTTLKRSANQFDLDETYDLPDVTFRSRKVARKNPVDDNLPGCTNDKDKDKDTVCSSTFVHGFSDKKSTPVTDKNGFTERYHVDFDSQNEVETVRHGNKDGVSCSWSMKKGENRDQMNNLPANIDDDLICYGDRNPIQASLHVRNEISSSTSVPQPGDHCFSGGLLGPDGTNWHLGKWCKKAQNIKPNSITGDLIAVGADGRGGRIKVMRSLDQTSSDSKDTSSWVKKCKLGAKPNKLMPKGHLQIEHFFRRTGQ
ncbi:hypothetical protein ABFS83_02G168000 [Erythranthe nasuta]